MKKLTENVSLILSENLIISGKPEPKASGKPPLPSRKSSGSFGLESRLEEFPFEAFEIEEARFFITEPFEKEYVVTGYGKCGSTPESGVEAPFLYAENGDDISLGYATGKIVMVNGPVRKDLYEKLVKAGAVAYLSISGTPIDEGEDLKPALYSSSFHERDTNPGQSASITETPLTS